jgi:hypothetical protein
MAAYIQPETRFPENVFIVYGDDGSQDVVFYQGFSIPPSSAGLTLHTAEGDSPRPSTVTLLTPDYNYFAPSFRDESISESSHYCDACGKCFGMIDNVWRHQGLEGAWSNRPPDYTPPDLEMWRCRKDNPIRGLRIRKLECTVCSIEFDTLALMKEHIKEYPECQGNSKINLDMTAVQPPPPLMDNVDDQLSEIMSGFGRPNGVYTP